MRTLAGAEMSLRGLGMRLRSAAMAKELNEGKLLEGFGPWIIGLVAAFFERFVSYKEEEEEGGRGHEKEEEEELSICLFLVQVASRGGLARGAGSRGSGEGNDERCPQKTEKRTSTREVSRCGRRRWGWSGEEEAEETIRTEISDRRIRRVGDARSGASRGLGTPRDCRAETPCGGLGPVRNLFLSRGGGKFRQQEWQQRPEFLHRVERHRPLD